MGFCDRKKIIWHGFLFTYKTKCGAVYMFIAFLSHCICRRCRTDLKEMLLYFQVDQLHRTQLLILKPFFKRGWSMQLHIVLSCYWALFCYLKWSDISDVKFVVDCLYPK
ncbi:hypothetical protein VPH35_073332 [Triticum aestivum]